MNTYLIYRAESFRIRNACFEVYKERGCGFTEPVYQEVVNFGSSGGVEIERFAN